MIAVILDGELRHEVVNCLRPCSGLLLVLGEELGVPIPSQTLGPQDNFLFSCLSNTSAPSFPVPTHAGLRHLV